MLDSGSAPGAPAVAARRCGDVITACTVNVTRTIPTAGLIATVHNRSGATTQLSCLVPPELPLDEVEI
jgi:hypothetical protein